MSPGRSGPPRPSNRKDVCPRTIQAQYVTVTKETGIAGLPEVAGCRVVWSWNRLLPSTGCRSRRIERHLHMTFSHVGSSTGRLDRLVSA